MRWKRRKPLTREQIRARIEVLSDIDLFIFVENAMMEAGETLGTGRSLGGMKYSAGLDHTREQLDQALVGVELMGERVSKRN